MEYISFYLSNFEVGGAQRVVINLASELAQRDLQVDIVVVDRAGPLEKELSSDVSVVDLKAGRALRSIRPLIKYLNQTEIDLLFSSLTYLNDVALFADILSRSSQKVLISEHNTRINSRWNLPVLGAKLLYKQADYVVAVSNGVAQNLSDWSSLSIDEIEVVYNPVVTDNLLEQASEQPNHPWYQNRVSPVIISAGRHVEQKDFPTLLRAFAEVQKEKEVKLIILGKGPRTAELKSLANELNISHAVEFPGFVENPYSYMSHSDLFVMSSAWEGLPTVLIEALACGTPIVSTDCPSGPAEILEEGKYGELVPVDNPNMLANSIKKALENPPQTQHLLNRAMDFTVDKAVEKYMDIISV